MAAVSLPDDVVLEIFFCIKNDRATLFRCATACKHWRRLIIDSSFLRRCWPTENDTYSFAGFFARKRYDLEKEAGVAPILGPSFVPVPRSPMGPDRRALVSFLPSVPAGLLDQAEPLASRHGLLLMCLDTSPNTIVARLAVCNPLAGTCHLLPPRQLNWHHGYKGYAILTCAGCRSSGPQRPTVSYFKVIVVDTKYGVYSFSSDEASWTRMSSPCFNHLGINIYESNAVVRRGTADWLGYNCAVPCLCLIDVNTETNQVSMRKIVTNLPQYRFRIRNHEPFLSLDDNGDNTLSVFWMKRECLQVEIWKQQDNKEGIGQDDYTSAWHCARVIELKQPHNKIEVEGRVLRILGEKCGILLVNDGKQRVYVAQLKTGIMEEVIQWPWGYVDHGEAQPFEMDWLAFFVSRLGGR